MPFMNANNNKHKNKNNLEIFESIINKRKKKKLLTMLVNYKK